MAKVTLDNLASITANETAAIALINTNMDRIEAAIEKTLSRDGTSPNSMSAVLDMNSRKVYNLPPAISATEPVRKAEFDAAVLGGAYYSTTVIDSMDSRFLATGDGVADDTAELQAAIDYLEDLGSGELIISAEHLISNNLTFNTAYPVTVRFIGKGKLICNFATAKTAMAFSGVWDGYETPAPKIINPNIMLHADAVNALSTAINITYTGTPGGGTAGPIIEGGNIEGVTGEDYFLIGIDLLKAPHTKISGVTLKGRGDVTTTKFGYGIRLGDWSQGTRIHACTIRGWASGIENNDDAVLDTSKYQAEGVSIFNNNLQSNTTGINIDLEDTEVAWRIYDNQFDQNDTNIHSKNLSGLIISNNSFGTQNGSHADIILDRTEDGVRTDKSLAALISGNRTLKDNGMNFDITSVSTGASTVVTYANTSTERNIDNITVDGDGYVTVDYSGADGDFRDGRRIIISGVTTPVEANGIWKMGDLDTTVDTFRLYDSSSDVTAEALVDGSTWAAYVGSASDKVARYFGTSTIANANAVFIDSVEGMEEINSSPYTVAEHDSGAKTFKLKNYLTGADVDSSAWGALTKLGRLTYYNRFVEVRAGARVDVTDNFVLGRNVGVHVWPEANRVEIRSQSLQRSASTAPINLINDSNDPTTVYLYTDDYVPFYAQAIGDGVADDTAALQAILTAGHIVNLDPIKTYKITSSLNITAANTGINGNGATLLMSTAAGHFDNEDDGNRYESNACAIRAIGTVGARISKPFVTNCIIRPDTWVDCRYLKGIYFKYTKDLLITGNDISNFSRGRGLITMNNVDFGLIFGNTLRDSYSLTAFETDGVTAITATQLQITGIECDNDADTITDEAGERYSSRGVRILANRIMNLTVGPLALAALGPQTDAINLNGVGKNTAANSKPTRGFIISGNYIYNVGEGIDCFGHGNVITNNYIRRAFASGCKFIHGASNNICSNNVIEQCGDLGIVLSSSASSDVTPANGNVIRGNTIRDINLMVDWFTGDGTKFFDSVSGSVAPNASGSCGIHIIVTTAASSQVTNTLIDTNYIDCGSGTGTLGIFIENNSGGSATQVVQDNIVLNNASDAYRDAQGYMSVRLAAGYTATTVTAATATLTDLIETVIANRAGTVTLTLGVARKGKRVYVKTITANTVVSASSNVIPAIGGAASTAILAATAGKWVILEGNGTNWEIIASN